MNQKLSYDDLKRKILDLEGQTFNQKCVNESLRVREKKYRLIIENVQAALWFVEIHSFRVTFANSYIEFLTGFRSSEVINQSIDKILTPSAYQLFIDTINKGLAKLKRDRRSPERSISLKLEFRHKKLNTNLVDSDITFMFDEKRHLYGIVGISKTIPALEPDLSERSSSHKIAFDHTATASVIVEEDTTISLVNSEFEHLSCYNKSEIEGQLSLTHFVSESDKVRIIEYHCLRRTNTPLVPRTYEASFVDKLGHIKPVYISESLIPNTKRGVVSILDITQIKKTEEAYFKQRAYFRQLFENSPQAILIVDTSGKIIDSNIGFETLFGYDRAKIKGQFCHHLFIPDDLRAEYEALHQTAVNGNAFNKETSRKHENGRILPVSVLGFPIQINNQIEGIFYIYNDISERKEFEEQLRHQAFHDTLTNVPNRLLFFERLERAVERKKRREDYTFAVLLVDLDRFKTVNDRLGHICGDDVLIEMSKRIEGLIRPVDTVARLGGDEFAILIEEFEKPIEVIDIAKQIKEMAEQVFETGTSQVQISASIGVVLKTDFYYSAQDVLRDADIAMYRAKEQGKARFKVFNKKMLEATIESLKIENELRQAIQRKEFMLYYQPIICVDTTKLEGFEALIRWNHPEKGIVSPEKFIPIAEETGLIIQIGEWVIQEAIQQLKQWETKHPNVKSITMSINISAKQFAQRGIVNFIAQALEDCDLPGQNLKIEITESILMVDSKLAVEKLTRLKEIGVKLAIDDFGTGYSSLSYLQQFPIDNLKIDQSFIKDLATDAESKEIVKTIVSLAKNLGLEVVAEGVEKEMQLSRLKDLFCDKAQGFLFSHPVDKVAAEGLLHKYL